MPRSVHRELEPDELVELALQLPPGCRIERALWMPYTQWASLWLSLHSGLRVEVDGMPKSLYLHERKWLRDQISPTTFIYRSYSRG